MFFLFELPTQNHKIYISSNFLFIYIFFPHSSAAHHILMCLSAMCTQGPGHSGWFSGIHSSCDLWVDPRRTLQAWPRHPTLCCQCSHCLHCLSAARYGLVSICVCVCVFVFLYICTHIYKSKHRSGALLPVSCRLQPYVCMPLYFTGELGREIESKRALQPEM